MNYDPEIYWNGVAKRLSNRQEGRTVAGDNNPFYRYKRKRLLALLKQLPFAGKKVLEIGPGPGGNLAEVYALEPKALHGADVSENMLEAARQNLHGKNIVLKKTDGERLPYPDGYFNLSYTVTVLQHNTDEAMLQKLVAEICRVTASDVYIFERIEKKTTGTPLCLGRPVAVYEAMFTQHGFVLSEKKFLHIQASYMACGVLRKVFNRRSRPEGMNESRLSILLQKLVLPITGLLDKVIAVDRDLAMLHFVRR